MIDRGNEVIRAFQSNLPQTIRLIEEGRVVLNTQIDVGPLITHRYTSFEEVEKALSTEIHDEDYVKGVVEI